MAKAIVMLTALLAADVFLPSLHAALTPSFTAGNGPSYLTAASGSSVSVPITVINFANLAGAQFTLTWDTGVLALQLAIVNGEPTPVVGGLDPALSSGSAFGNPSAGTFTWLWSNQAGATVADGNPIFSVQFTAIGAAGTSSFVNFGDSPTPRDVTFLPLFNEATPDTVNGGVTVVPEPINWALGLFACVFIGSATVRWVSGRRMSLQSAQAVSHDEAGV
jgi:hypothetical protein